VNTPHPELDTLAELAEHGDHVEPASSPALADAGAHVASCPTCSAEVAALRNVTQALRSLPEIPMPDDVAARLESALLAEAGTVAGGASVSVLPDRSGSSARSSSSGTFGSSSSGFGRGSGGRLPHFSAAAAVTLLVIVALGAGIGVLVSHGGGGGAKSASTAVGALATDKTTVLTSGANYSQSAIRNQVAALVLSDVPQASSRYDALHALARAGAAAANGSQPAASGQSKASTSSTYGTSSSANLPSSAPSAPLPLSTTAPTAPGGPLASSAALKACIVALVQRPVTPILVDYARYEGRQATIIVLPDPDVPNVLDVYVEDYTADCVTKGEVTFFGTLPTTSP
jgi:hypothetical protein